MEPLTKRLEGTIVVLEPLREEHAEELWEAAQAPEIWEWLANLNQRDRFDRWLELTFEAAPSGTEGPVPDPPAGSGRAVGSSRYLNVRPQDRVVEIGWTWLNPRAWRTGANVEAKLLMLEHAFETLELRAGRVQDRRPQRALAGGARRDPGQFEGVLRNHMIVPDVGLRDSAYFSVIDERVAGGARQPAPPPGRRARKVGWTGTRTGRVGAAKEEDPMYDYVIVGAGSAGCVLAARLSGGPGRAACCCSRRGRRTSTRTSTSRSATCSSARTEVDWDYHSAPEPHCDGRRITLPRGKVLGGSSSINAMVYIRGNRRDYDEWGVPGWAWDDLLPVLPQGRGQRARRLASGTAPAGRCRSASSARGNPISPRLRRGRRRRPGLARNEDFNGAEQDGVGMYQVTQRGGMRASAAVAYLHPAMERPNLTVMPYMHVHRVLFEGTRAVGVEATPARPGRRSCAPSAR